MRVIAGGLRGRRIDAPRSGVRPTYDRVRESLFGIVGTRTEGANVLDLFAGSGILGIECLSRGALAVTFVERDPSTLAVVRANVDRLGIADASELLRVDAIRFLTRPASGRSFDIVFVDPPYESGLAERALALLSTWRGLAPGALVVVEARAGGELPESSGTLRRTRRKRYGSIEIDFYEALPRCGAGKEET
jgi:16S rRNA (guanine966-N2)-methyltransferase